VNKLIITTGPSFSDPMMNSELVDFHANINIINQFSLYLKETNSISANSDSDSDIDDISYDDDDDRDAAAADDDDHDDVMMMM